MHGLWTRWARVSAGRNRTSEPLRAGLRNYCRKVLIKLTYWIICFDQIQSKHTTAARGNMSIAREPWLPRIAPWLVCVVPWLPHAAPRMLRKYLVKLWYKTRGNGERSVRAEPKSDQNLFIFNAHHCYVQTTCSIFIPYF